MKEKEDEVTDEKCVFAKPDYETLHRKVQSLEIKIFDLRKENEALRYSLTQIYKDLEQSQTALDIFEEDYYKEHERAEKLYDELHQEELK